MVDFDRKNCQSRAKNLGHKTEFCAKCTLGWLNFARKSFALSGLFCAKWYCAKCTFGVTYKLGLGLLTNWGKSDLEIRVRVISNKGEGNLQIRDRATSH